MPFLEKPDGLNDAPEALKARGQDKYCLVIGSEITMYPGGDMEPPKYGCCIQYVVAKTKKEAIRKVVDDPEDDSWGMTMKDYLDEVRGESYNPMWALWCSYIGVVENPGESAETWMQRKFDEKFLAPCLTCDKMEDLHPDGKCLSHTSDQWSDIVPAAELRRLEVIPPLSETDP